MQIENLQKVTEEAFMVSIRLLARAAEGMTRPPEITLSDAKNMLI